MLQDVPAEQGFGYSLTAQLIRGHKYAVSILVNIAGG